MRWANLRPEAVWGILSWYLPRLPKQCIHYPVMTRIEQLVEQGHTSEEAEDVLRLIEVAVVERDEALRTGRCGCGGRLARYASVVECVDNCGFVANAAAA